jgi:hypothetical protein
MSKTYLKSDHFNGGGSCSRRAVVSASPQSGISLRDISAELAQRGIMNDAVSRSLRQILAR